MFENEDAARYEYRIEGTVCAIEYIRTAEGNLYLTHTEVPDELSGKGIGTDLVRSVLEDLEKKGVKIVPLCTFVAAYIERHPEWGRLVLEDSL